MAAASCIKRLQNTFRELQKDPVEGILAEIPDESNMLVWNIWMDGPPDSAYAKGIFQLEMKFPTSFPMEPPELKFLSEFWHPNVYKDGKICISILHPPGEDVMSGERPEERWLPTHSVSSIMLSIISMLNDPNISSPANMDASLEWRHERPKFVARCAKLAEKSLQYKPDYIVIPHPETDPKQKQKQIDKQKLLNDYDFMIESDGDYNFDDDDGSYDMADGSEPIESESESEEKPKKKPKSSGSSKDTATKSSSKDKEKSKTKASSAAAPTKKDEAKKDLKKSKDKSSEKKKDDKKSTDKSKKKEEEDKAKKKEEEKKKKKEEGKKKKESKKEKEKEKTKSKTKSK